jgi:hypothetical protein
MNDVAGSACKLVSTIPRTALYFRITPSEDVIGRIGKCAHLYLYTKNSLVCISVPYQIKPLSSRLELILIKSSQADLKSIQAETKPNQAGLI